MALTYLKESEGAYPYRLVPGHFPLKPMAPARKYNMRANFTPNSNAATEPTASDTQVGQSRLVPQYKQPQHGTPMPTLPGATAPMAATRGLFASTNATPAGPPFASDKLPLCNCGSRRVEVLNLTPDKFSAFSELISAIGELEQEPQVDASNKVFVQFYDARAAQSFVAAVPTVAVLSGVVARHVTLEVDVAVLIDIPWGHSATCESLLLPLERYGAVASLNLGKPLIGGPQQVVCVYNDVRDAAKVSNKVITVGGARMTARLRSVSHAEVCPRLGTNGRQQPPFSMPLGALDSKALTHPRSHTHSLPSAFASPASSISTLASPFSTSRSDMPGSLFPSIDDPWLGAPSPSKNGASHSEPALNHLGSQPTQHRQHSADLSRSRHIAPNDIGSEHALPHSALRVSPEPMVSEIFRGSYGAIGSRSTSNIFEGVHAADAFGGPPKHDSAINQISPLKPVGTPPSGSSVDSSISAFEQPNATPPREGSGIGQDINKSVSILKKFASTDGAVAAKDSRQTESSGNDINLDAIARGEESRTTVMLRNIPNKLDFKDLKRFLDATNRCAYDFLYLRFDFVNRCNVGYAFISFTKPRHVAAFVKARAGMKWSQYGYNSEKVIEIKFARIQGRDSLIQKFRNSPVMSQDAAFKPRLYYTKGKLSGKEEPFPEPTDKQDSS